MIIKPAIWADGTDAKLVVYDEEECSSVVIVAQLDDEMAGSCLQIVAALEFFRDIGREKMKCSKVLCKDFREYDKEMQRSNSSPHKQNT